MSSRLIWIGAAVMAVSALWLWLRRDETPVSSARPGNAPRCGDGVVNAANEQCDGSALPADVATGARCGADCRIVGGERCGDAVLAPDEECDGTKFRSPAPPGASCSSTCTIVAASSSTARCGDAIINSPSEECDGQRLPPGAPPGSQCSAKCRLTVPATVEECKECAQKSCAAERGEVEKNRATAGPLLECVLGNAWESWGQVVGGSCAYEDLLTCYCGTLPGQDCATAAPSALSGPCVAEVLVATDCTTSQCVATRFMNPENPNGKAMQYVMCEQDNCYEACFN